MRDESDCPDGAPSPQAPDEGARGNGEARRSTRADISPEQLTEIAALYYLEQVTQEELSRRFALSRPTISKLLKRAREEGIVEIRVRTRPAASAELEQEFRRRFRIERLLTAVEQRDPDAQRDGVAALLASHLENILRDEMIVAVGMGRNVAAIADQVGTQVAREIVFVSAIGGSTRAGEYMSSDHICRRLAARFGGESETLYAPALVADPEIRRALMQNEVVRRTLHRAQRADVALIGIGDVSEESNMVRMGWFSPQEVAAAKLAGTVGDMMGYDFITVDGQAADVPMQGRVIGLSLDDLRRIPNVVAIASESSKLVAIMAALRTGTITTLATTETIARDILRLDGESDPVRAR
ncbi:sugar-binding transcriptional regulator [Gluconacetobacter asukensis]|uniref:Helix-turn-helix domain-containing protein n=1 Tax=Gluconacetobacter asukensis TaxID=1017181 RepID=A0A7W4NZ58_9PROT|nr:sugar-binding domain-containing protein [Gluconacetobacter asukensis]MBB2171537.1 helix-turn-helix domain-containing protein [Gluconacetobacter asukensis]